MSEWEGTKPVISCGKRIVTSHLLPLTHPHPMHHTLPFTPSHCSLTLSGPTTCTPSHYPVTAHLPFTHPHTHYQSLSTHLPSTHPHSIQSLFPSPTHTPHPPNSWELVTSREGLRVELLEHRSRTWPLPLRSFPFFFCPRILHCVRGGRVRGTCVWEGACVCMCM